MRVSRRTVLGMTMGLVVCACATAPNVRQPLGAFLSPGARTGSQVPLRVDPNSPRNRIAIQAGRGPRGRVRIKRPAPSNPPDPSSNRPVPPRPEVGANAPSMSAVSAANAVGEAGGGAVEAGARAGTATPTAAAQTKVLARARGRVPRPGALRRPI